MKLRLPNRRLVKIGLGAIVVLAALGLLAATLIWLFLPRERIRAAIDRELSQRLGQTVSIERVSVGFYPDIEFVAKGITMADPSSDHVLLSVEKIRIDIALRDLLNRRFVPEEISVDSPTVNLVRNAEGKWNLETFLDGARRNGGPSSAGVEPSSRPAIGPVRVRNGAVGVVDEVTGRTGRVEKISATIDSAEDRARIDSALVRVTPIEAEVHGTVSQLSKGRPFVDAGAAIRVKKAGPLADSLPSALRPGATVGVVSIDCSGPVTALAFKATAKPERWFAGGLAANAVIEGTVRAKEERLDIASLNVSAGHSKVSLSGSAQSIMSDARMLNLAGNASIAPAELLAVTDAEFARRFEPAGTATGAITLAASAERIDVKTDIDLRAAGFTLPDVLRKEPGSQSSLSVAASYLIPGELTVDKFAFALGGGRIDGTGRVKSGAQPWATASVHTVAFPLENLNRLPSVHLTGGTVAAIAELWRNQPDGAPVEYSGQAAIRGALVTTDELKGPAEVSDARVTFDSHKARVVSASFLFAESQYRASAEITDFQSPRIVGEVATPLIDLDAIAASFAEEEPESPSKGTSAAEESGEEPDFSLELLVAADALYAGKIQTGPISTTWRTTGRTHTFSPFYARAFGGAIDGSVEIEPTPDGVRWSAALKGNDLRLQRLSAQLQDGETRVKGVMGAEADLHCGAAADGEPMLGCLGGTLKVAVAEGEIKRYAMLKNILLLMQINPSTVLVPGVREITILNTAVDAATSRGRSLDPTSVTFNKIDGTFAITDGVARTDDLKLESGTANLLFKGDIDLGKETMDMTVSATPLGAIGSLMGKVPFAGKALQKAKEATLSTDFIVRGPISDPEVTSATMDKIKNATNGE
jgi:uncharacterized protein involved in outer membrane biogenesis